MNDTDRARQVAEGLFQRIAEKHRQWLFDALADSSEFFLSTFAAIRQEERERVQEYIQRWYDSDSDFTADQILKDVLQWLEREATP